MKGIPDYSKWTRTIGRGIKTWQRGDTDDTGPTGPKSYPVFYHPEDNETVRESIRSVNSHCPRVGQRIDPWTEAKDEFVKIGGVIEEYCGDELLRVNYGMHIKDGSDYYHYYTFFAKDMNTYAKRGDIREYRTSILI